MHVDKSSAMPITATVTAYRRIEQTLVTIDILLNCQPPPDEILVHVDAGGAACFEAVRKKFPGIQLLTSDVSVGPGGGRNKLMQLSRNELVANFDDDSYPIDVDYFARAMELMASNPSASMITGKVFHRGETLTHHEKEVWSSASFCGGAVVFKRSHLIETGGYLPLTIAYGAEEEDMALRLFHQGRKILFSPWLRIFHDTNLAHHGSRAINAQTLANIGLVIFLRYPVLYWPYGFAQIINRMIWCARNGRSSGLLSGLLMMPGQFIRHRHLRSPISISAMQARQAIKRGLS